MINLKKIWRSKVFSLQVVINRMQIIKWYMVLHNGFYLLNIGILLGIISIHRIRWNILLLEYHTYQRGK